jgi:hypothetical protein
VGIYLSESSNREVGRITIVDWFIRGGLRGFDHGAVEGPVNRVDPCIHQCTNKDLLFWSKLESNTPSQVFGFTIAP